MIGPVQRSDCEIWILKEGQKIFEKFFYVPVPDVVIRNGSAYYKSINLSDLDFVIPRIPRTYTWFGYKILKILQGSVYMPIEPEAVIISHNKFLSLLVLKEAGLPVPDTFLTVSRQALEGMLDTMQFPVVMKLLYGSLGKGVMFADTKQSAKSMMDTLERFKEPIFLEEYVPNPGEDIRAFVLGDKVLGAEKRKAQHEERRTNIGIGGHGEPVKLDRRTAQLAVRAAKVLGMPITGIDIIQGPKGPMLIEANVNVHFEGITNVLKLNVAKSIVEYVRDEARFAQYNIIGRFFEWLIERRPI